MFWYVAGYNLSQGIKKYEDAIRKSEKHTFTAGSEINLDITGSKGYIVLNGEIRCDFNTKTKRSLGLISLQVGECFGWIDTPQDVNVILMAIGEVIVTELPADTLKAVAKASDDVHLTFYKGIFRSKTVVAVNPGALIFKLPRIRLEEALKILAGKIGKRRGNYILIKLKSTSGRLAGMAGLGRVHTILIIANLYKERKIIPGVKTLALFVTQPAGVDQ